MQKLLLSLAMVYSAYAWGGRPVIHEKELPEITRQADYILLAEFQSSSEVQDSNKCGILSHNLKVVKIIKPENDKSFDLNKNYLVGINPMWAQDCLLRKEMGKSGASFYAEKFNKGVDISKLKKGDRVVYFVNRSHDTKIPWTLVMNGAILDPQQLPQDKVFNLPFNQESWTILTFNKIPKNKVEFVDNQLRVGITNSASPTIYKFENPINIKEFSVLGNLSGIKKVEDKTFDEDSVLRFGLVAAGTKTLTGPKSLVAANWVKKLFELAPKNTGIDQIYFFNITNRKDLIGNSRKHPSSDLMLESLDFFHAGNGEYLFSKKFDKPIKTVAIWLSIDGDGTKSSFENQIRQITVKSE